MKTIGVVGSRRRDSDSDYLKVLDAFLKEYEIGDVICSGLCPKGADRFAVLISEYYKVKSLWFPANWRRYGRGAGFKRDTDIARESDVLIACTAPDRTGGTEDTIKKYLKLGKGRLVLV